MMAKRAFMPIINTGENYKNKEFYHNAKTLQPVSLKFYEKLVVTRWLSSGGGGGMGPIKT